MHIFFDRIKRAEYKFLKQVILQISKFEFWSEKNLRVIDSEFKKFVKRMKMEELYLLRKGEVFLGEYAVVNKEDLNDVRDLMHKCVEHIDEISVPICVVMIAALNKSALSLIDGKVNLEDNIEEE